MAERRYLPALTGLRFCAAAHVVLFHARDSFLLGLPAGLSLFLSFGAYAVPLFFVLSGFVLTHGYLPTNGSGQVDRRRFWVARFARLYPVYLVSLAMSLPFYVAVLVKYMSPELSVPAAFGSVLVPVLLQAWTPLTALLWNGPAWSLSVEAAFYAAFPFLLPRLAGRSTRVLWVVLLGCLVMAAGPQLAVRSAVEMPVSRTGSDALIVNPIFWVLDYFPPLRLPFFVAGVVAALLWQRIVRLPHSAWLAAGGIGAVVVSVGSIMAWPAFVDYVGSGLLLPFFCLLIVALAGGAGPLARLLSIRPIVLLGEASYATYLLHIPVFEVMRSVAERIFGNVDGNTPFILAYFVTVLAVSLAVYLAIERPARRAITQRFTAARVARPAATTVTSFQQRYLLCSHIVLHRASDGRCYADPLWHKDLLQHLRYLDHLTLAAPVVRREPAAGMRVLPASLRIVALPASRSVAQALARMPATALRLWRAIDQSEVVHVGIAGWPLPIGWLAVPLARVRGRRCLVVVESAPWRLHAARRPTARARLKALIYERLGRWCVGRCQLAVFTQPAYRRSLGSPRGHSEVVPASWIDDENLLRPAAVDRSWREKQASAERDGIALAFCGRLEVDKGVTVLLEALERLQAGGARLRLDVLGDGPLRRDCLAATQRLREPVEVRLIGTVDYGPALFERLRGYHALVVPSLSDEQPRIVYDAFSQAVPVLASDTPGLRACVRDGQTGVFVIAGDVAGWTARLAWAAKHPEELERLGRGGLEVARGVTHAATHERRRALLVELLGFQPAAIA
jgi:peptidoglycan/LPS O-acetylase OafA/YrhL